MTAVSPSPSPIENLEDAETPGTSISFRHRMEYGLLKGFETLIGLLPLSMVEALGRILGSLVWLLYPLRFETVFTNISFLFPKMDRAEKLKLAHRTYRHHGYMFFTFLIISRKDMRARIARSRVTRGRRCIPEALEKGRGIILTGLHFGYWEASSAWMCLQGYPLTGIYRVQKNPLVDRYFIAKRMAFSDRMRHIPRENAGQIVKELKANRLLAVIMDQRAGRRGTPVRFMNRIVQIPKGAAFLHMRTGAPILWIAPMVRDGEFFIEYGQFDLPRYRKISEANLNALTQRIMSHHEKIVRRYPEQWFWFHKLMPKKEYPRRVRRTWRDIRESLFLS